VSSILKALKKVENDKRSSRPDQFGIDTKILQDTSSIRFSRTSVTLIAVVLFVCGCGATHVYMRNNPAITVAMPAQSPLGKSMGQTPETSPVTNGSPVQNTQSKQAAPKPPPIFATLSHLRNTSSATLSRATKPGQQAVIAPIPVSPPVSLPSSPVSVITIPKLTVNGIAFQEGGSENMAIINGVSVSSGAVIEGVRVEEIQRDRVRFSSNGENFEIRLNKSNR
jgi:general secretion pathway protein B